MAAWCSRMPPLHLISIHAGSSEPSSLWPSPGSLQDARPSLRPSAAGRRLGPRTHRRARARSLCRTRLGDTRLLSSRQRWQPAALDSESTSAASASTAVRDSSDTAANSLPHSESSAGTPGPEGSSEGHASPHAESEAGGAGPQDREEEKVTKDVVALRSLDAYFEKLQGPKAKEEVQPPDVKAEAKSSAAAALEALRDVSKAASSEGTKAGGGKPKDAEIVDELKRIIEAIEANSAVPQQGEGKEGEDRDGPQFQVYTLGAPSPYQRWLDTQLFLRPPSALNAVLAINVAVFLFELATPEAVPGVILTSLPSLLGAKVNALISGGEWWRLVTPMFLHAGFFHILVGSLVLLSLGPSVEVAFGSFGFLAAYFVGGVFGNLMSFLQTPDVTVGGTGPIYGILGAYLVYLWKNKDAIGKGEAEVSLGSLIFFGALNVAFGSALPIDDWTHIGAALGGLLFGALAAPTLKRLSSGDMRSELEEMIKEWKTAGLGKVSESRGEGSTGSSSTSDSAEDKSPVREPKVALFSLEGPGPLRQALIAAGCLGVAALLLQLSTAGIPADLVDVSSHIISL